MNISQAAIGLAVVLIGVALVWATPRLDRFAQDSVLSAETALGGAGRRLKWIGRLLDSCCTTILTASVPHNFVNRPGQRLVDSLELLVANR